MARKQVVEVVERGARFAEHSVSFRPTKAQAEYLKELKDRGVKPSTVLHEAVTLHMERTYGQRAEMERVYGRRAKR